MRKKPEPLAYPELLEYAIRAVTARAMSISQLRQKLLRRAAVREDVDGVIQRLKDAGALDDRAFADSFAASRLGNQGFGRMRVLRDLRARRVAPAVADEAVSSAYMDVNEVSLIENYLQRKYRGKNLPVYLAEDKNLASAFRKLRTAGFSGANSIRVLKQYSRRADELEEIEAEGEPTQ